jgi:hypothetical protein
MIQCEVTGFYKVFSASKRLAEAEAAVSSYLIIYASGFSCELHIYVAVAKILMIGTLD